MKDKYFFKKKYNIERDYDQYNAWKSSESFCFDKDMDAFLKDKFIIKEYVFEGIEGNRDNSFFKERIKVFIEGMIDLIFKNKTVYMFIVEPSAHSTSKLRSYKKYLKIDNKINVIEKEYFEESYSRFAAIVEINKINFMEMAKYFFDSNYSFIYTSKKEENFFFNELYLDKIFNKIGVNKGSHINLFEIVKDFTDKDHKVFRIGGNEGEEYWSLQEFYLDKN